MACLAAGWGRSTEPVRCLRPGHAARRPAGIRHGSIRDRRRGAAGQGLGYRTHGPSAADQSGCSARVLGRPGQRGQEYWRHTLRTPWGPRALKPSAAGQFARRRRLHPGLPITPRAGGVDKSFINHRKRYSPPPKVHSPAVLSRLCVKSDKLGMARTEVDDAISYHRRRQLRCGVQPTTPALSAGVRVPAPGPMRERSRSAVSPVLASTPLIVR